MEKYGNNQNKADRPPDQIFRITKEWKVISVVATIFFGVICGINIGLRKDSWAEILFLNGGSVGITSLSFYISVSAFKERIEIYPDRIKDIGIFRTTELLISEISGFMGFPNGIVALLPKDAKAKRIEKNFLILERQSDLWEWLNKNLVYLDMKDFQMEMKQQIQKKKWPDKSGEYMQWKLNSAKKWSRTLDTFGLILSLWAIFYPRPYKFTIWLLIIFPVVVLGFIHHFGKLLDIAYERFVFPTILFFSCSGLAFRAICDWNILCWNKVFWPVAFFFACFCFLLFSVNRELKWKAGTVSAYIFISLFFSLFYGCPSAIILNGMLDTSTPSIYKTMVIKKQISNGYFLKLLSWGTEYRGRTVHVSKSAYYKYKPGDTIDVIVKDGRFGIPWVTVD